MFVKNILVFIAKILIAIGDMVLFLLSSIILIINLSIFLVLEALKTIFKPLIAPFSRKKMHLIYAYNHKKHRLKKRKRVIFFPFILKLKYFTIGIFFSFFFIFLPFLVVIFLNDLPSPKTLTVGLIPQTTKILDRHGNILYQIYAAQNRTLVPLADISNDLKNATIAIEDKDFYKHPGFDIIAIVRSAIENLSGNGLQGGSTLTQQLIKSALLTPEPTIERKVKEIILAFWAERTYSKDEIFELYFNYIPYGGTAWGAEAASQVYFAKNVKDLNLSESAFLAGMPKAPTVYSPFGSNPTLWKQRQKEVLKRMVELGFVSQSQADEAYAKELTFVKPRIPINAPHFVMYIKDLLVKNYGLPMVEKGGLIVKTSLDLPLQEMAQRIVEEEVANNAVLNVGNGAALITSPRNGDILAMVGSRNFYDTKEGNVNLTTSLRQPGSSIKIVTYAAAFQNGYTATSVLDDSPVSFPGASGPYSPVNYDGAFHGKIPLRLAFANSFNIPAVKTLNHIGVATMVDLAKKMGITTWKDPDSYGLSITLGSAEVKMTDMATVYGVFANGGVRVNLNPILKVTDYKGNVLEEKKQIIGLRVVDEGIVYIISDILADNSARAMEFGTNSPLNIPGKKVSVKTGTSDNKRDNWTVGYTPSYVVAAWVGNNDNSPMSQNLASGITGAAPIWNKVMTNLIQGNSTEELPRPQNVIQRFCFGKIEYFIEGTEKSAYCPQRPFITPSPTP